MENSTKLGIVWIIALVYFPIGLNIIIEVNKPIFTLLAFIGIAILIFLTTYYSIDSKRGK